MYAIKWTDDITKKSGLLLSPFNLKKNKPVMTFDTKENADENVQICINVAKEDKTNISYEVIEYNPQEV